MIVADLAGPERIPRLNDLDASVESDFLALHDMHSAVAAQQNVALPYGDATDKLAIRQPVDDLPLKFFGVQDFDRALSLRLRPSWTRTGQSGGA